MKITSKIVFAALGAVTITVTGGLLIQRKVIRDQGIELTRETMRVAILQAESTRESISALNRRNAFDMNTLLAEYKKSGDLRNSSLYKTVPVVAAWTSIEETAKKENFEFRVPKHQARNAAAEESASASEELTAQAAALRDAVASLVELVGTPPPDVTAHHPAGSDSLATTQQFAGFKNSRSHANVGARKLAQV